MAFLDTMITDVLLLGPSSTEGAAILNAFRNKPSFTISVAIPPGSSYTVPVHESTKFVPIHEVDYQSDQSILNAFEHKDAVVSTLSPHDFDLNRRIINALVLAKVKHFIPREFGVDTDDPFATEVVPAADRNRAFVNLLRQEKAIGFAKKLAWTALIAGAHHTGFFGYDFTNHVAQIFGNETVFFEMTSMHRLGEAVVKCLEKTEQTANQYVYVHSFRVSQRQIYDAISSASRSQAWVKEPRDIRWVYDEASRNSSSTEWNMGFPSAVGAMFMGSWYGMRIHDFEGKTVHWAGF